MERRGIAFRLGRFVRWLDWRAVILATVLAYIWGFNSGAEWVLREDARMFRLSPDDPWRKLHEEAILTRYRGQKL